MFKCFGCGESGDVFTFIQKIEHIEFPQALEKLAKEAGVTLQKSNDPKFKKLSRMREAHKVAADFFHYILISHAEGKNALKYALKVRKLSLEIINEFQIGYAPGRNTLQGFLKKKGFSDREILDAGFINSRGNDKFAGRLMFPIFDVSGRVVGFSGRILVKDDKRPKYLNSAESDLYKKRFLLFGLHKAKGYIDKADFAILCEGQIDAIMSQQVGVKNIVAPLGTALTDTQLDLIKRFSKNVAFCFDNDEAGQKSLSRGVKIALQQRMHPFIVSLPSDVNDIDDLIQKRSDDWKDRAANYKDFFEVKFLELKSIFKRDPVVFDRKLQELLEIVSVASSLKQGIIAKQCADILNLPENAVLESIKKKVPMRKFQAQLKKQNGSTSTAEFILAMIVTFPMLTIIMGKPSVVKEVFVNKAHFDLYSKMYAFANDFRGIIESVFDESFENIKTSWDQVYTRFTNEVSLDYGKFVAKLSEEDKDLSLILEDLMFSEYTQNITISDDVIEDFFKTWNRLRKQSVTLHLEKFRQELVLAETNNDENEVKRLANILNELLLKLRELK